MVSLGLAIGIAIGAAGLGVGGGVLLTNSANKDAQAAADAAHGAARAAEGAADAVRAAVAPLVAQAETDQQVTATDRVAWVCDPEEGTYSEDLCAVMLVCSLGVADGEQVAKVCDELVNQHLSGKTWALCEAAPDQQARTRCYSLHEKRK